MSGVSYCSLCFISFVSPLISLELYSFVKVFDYTSLLQLQADFVTFVSESQGVAKILFWIVLNDSDGVGHLVLFTNVAVQNK